MGSIWLNGDTAGYPPVLDVLRGAGITVVTYDGYQTRSRSSGGFNQLMVVYHHHTASNTTPANDVNYCINGPDAPIANCLLDRTGTVHLYACGATNHAGKGGGSDSRPPWQSSRGTVPKDAGNSNGFGIECANAGTGEPYPVAQQDAYAAMSRALCAAYGLVPALDLPSHFEWTDRKCDPTGPSRWTPPGNRLGCGGADRWDMNLYRAEVAAGQLPAPTPEGDNMLTIFTVDGAGAAFLGFTWDGLGQQVEWLDTQAKLDTYRAHHCPELRIGLADCRNLYLLGPVPSGDHKHQWARADFRGVIDTA